MKWPKGKYNGQRIAGFEIKFSIYLFRWYFIPKFYWRFYKSFHWLCFHIYISNTYET